MITQIKFIKVKYDYDSGEFDIRFNTEEIDTFILIRILKRCLRDEFNLLVDTSDVETSEIIVESLAINSIQKIQNLIGSRKLKSGCNLILIHETHPSPQFNINNAVDTFCQKHHCERSDVLLCAPSSVLT